MHRLLRILLVFGMASILLACPGYGNFNGSGNSNDATDSTSTTGTTDMDTNTDISTLALSYNNVTGLAHISIQKVGPTWDNPTWEANTPALTYTVDPALPDGLSMDNTTGIISGTPTIAQAETSYTVTATSVGSSYTGTQVTTMTITIVNTKIGLYTNTFSYEAITGIKNVALTETGPAWDDVPTATYTVTPALPDGLSIDSTTGIISGIPTVVQAKTSYTITATGTIAYAGTKTTTVAITIQSNIHMDNIFARWKESDSYATLTKTMTGTAIGTVDELKNIQHDLAGTYYLIANIDVSGAMWEPLGSSGTPFTGTFHGNGYIIHGLKIEATSTDADQGTYQGLFAVVNNAIVEDVGIGVVYVSAVERAGALAGEARGTSKIDNVAVARMVDTAEITVSQYVAGGVVGTISGTAEVSNAYNLEMVVKSPVTETSVSAHIGGLVGRADSANKIHGYMFTGGNSTMQMVSGKMYVGGLVGSGAKRSEVRGFVSGAGEIVGEGTVGGLVGESNGGIIRGYFDGGVVRGTDSTIGHVGGLLGKSGQSSENTVIGYVTNATIQGELYVGGLVGWAYVGVISGYVINSTITANGYHVGGLAGQVYSSDRTVISGYVENDIYNKVKGLDNVGGFVGRVLSSPHLTGIAKITGYVSTFIDTGKITQRAFVGYGSDRTIPFVPLVSIAGYWDFRAMGFYYAWDITDFDEPQGTLISYIVEIVYDNTTGEYTDRSNENTKVFDDAGFLTQFSLPKASARWPALRPYRILPYGITMSVDDAVHLLSIAPWDNTEAVTWSSSDAAIVSVDADGVATAQAAGSATVTATWSGGGTATMSITVQ